MKTIINLLLPFAVMAAISCSSNLTMSGLDPKNFEKDVDGLKTGLFTLKNASGMEVNITNFGGRIVSVNVPDRDGNFLDVVLGFDSVEGYINIPSDFGAFIGRYANRIAMGKFTLDGKEYILPRNNGTNCLHGGPDGWQYKVGNVLEADASHIVLEFFSPDMEMGFPGDVRVKVTYTLTDDNRIDIRYEAVASAPTVINVTNHSYFNLTGDGAKNVLAATLFVNADTMTPTNADQIPTGEITSVESTPFDFREPHEIGRDIDDFSNEQMKIGLGIDHNWILNTNGDINAIAARVSEPSTGIVLTVYTDEPGLQIYTGNFLDGTITGKYGRVYNKRAAICLESQHYPDSPNQPSFPTTVLRPGEKFESRTIFAFSTE